MCVVVCAHAHSWVVALVLVPASSEHLCVYCTVNYEDFIALLDIMCTYWYVLAHKPRLQLLTAGGFMCVSAELETQVPLLVCLYSCE